MTTKRAMLWLVMFLTAAVGGGWVGFDTSVAAEPAQQRYRFQQVQMGMPVELVLYAADEEIANRAAQAAYDRFAELNRSLSDYDPESELSRLSATAGRGQAVRVSDDLWLVLRRAAALSAATEGAFDVTVGPLTRLWRRSRRQRELPSPERLVEARAAVGHQYVQFDPAAQTVTLLRPNMRLDLGGIAAGYAVDEALKVLRRHGVPRALVDASGDIGVGDAPPGAAGWRLGVTGLDGKARLEGGNEPLRYLLLSNAAVTTSGDAFQFVEIAGVRYSHIVDPTTGLGLTNRSAVTVVARDCITADSVATAVCVLGPERGLKFIATQPGIAGPGIEALITWQAADKVNVVESAGFKQHAAPASE